MSAEEIAPGPGSSLPGTTAGAEKPDVASRTQQQLEHKPHTSAPELGELVFQQCPQCTFHYCKPKERVAHQQVHQETPDPALHFHCKRCPYATDELKQFKHHSSFHFGDRLPVTYKCQECAMETTQFDHLNEHMRDEHNNAECRYDAKQIESQRPEWPCQLCNNKYFSQKMYLIVHLYKVHNRKLTAGEVKMMDQRNSEATTKGILMPDKHTTTPNMAKAQQVTPEKPILLPKIVTAEKQVSKLDAIGKWTVSPEEHTLKHDVRGKLTDSPEKPTPKDDAHVNEKQMKSLEKQTPKEDVTEKWTRCPERQEMRQDVTSKWTVMPEKEEQTGSVTTKQKLPPKADTVKDASSVETLDTMLAPEQHKAKEITVVNHMMHTEVTENSACEQNVTEKNTATLANCTSEKEIVTSDMQTEMEKLHTVLQHNQEGFYDNVPKITTKTESSQYLVTQQKSCENLTVQQDTDGDVLEQECIGADKEEQTVHGAADSRDTGKEHEGEGSFFAANFTMDQKSVTERDSASTQISAGDKYDDVSSTPIQDTDRLADVKPGDVEKYIKSSGKNKFTCTLCNRSYNYKDNTKRHIKEVHFQYRPFKCPYCTSFVGFTYNCTLMKHLEKMHPGLPYKHAETLKPEISSLSTNFSPNKLKQTVGEAKSTGHDKLATSSERSLVGSTGRRRALKFSCKFCEYESLSLAGVHIHSKKKHSTRVELDQMASPSTDVKNLSISDRLTTTSSHTVHGLSTHVGAVHGMVVKEEIPSDSEEKPQSLLCTQCPFKANSSHGLAIHFGMMHGEDVDKEETQSGSTGKSPLFSCKHCSFKANSPHGLRTHYGMKHPKVKLTKDIQPDSEVQPSVVPCKLCSYKSTTAHGLFTHIRLIHPEVNWTEEEVRSSFLHKECISSLETLNERQPQSNVSTGTEGVSPSLFACKYCAYESRSRGGVLIHSHKMHPQEMPGTKEKCGVRDIYPCKFCPYSATTSKALLFHVKFKHPNLSMSSKEKLVKKGTQSWNRGMFQQQNKKSQNCVSKQGKNSSWNTIKYGRRSEYKIKSKGVHTCYHCGLCGFKTDKSTNMKTHLRGKELGYKPYHCGHCQQFQAAGRSEIIKHSQQRHRGQQVHTKFIPDDLLEQEVGKMMKKYLVYVATRNVPFWKGNTESNGKKDTWKNVQSYRQSTEVPLDSNVIRDEGKSCTKAAQPPSLLAGGKVLPITTKNYRRQSKKTDGVLKCYQCCSCGHKSTLVSNMRKHQMAELSYKPYYCTECAYRTTDRNKAPFHMHSVHGIDRDEANRRVKYVPSEQMEEELESMMKKSIVYVKKKHLNSWLKTKTSAVPKSVQENSAVVLPGKGTSPHEYRGELCHYRDEAQRIPVKRESLLTLKGMKENDTKLVQPIPYPIERKASSVITKKYLQQPAKTEFKVKCYQCLCGYKSRIVSDMRKHQMAREVGYKPYHCTECKYNATEQTKCLQHIQTVHQTGQSEAKRKVKYVPDKQCEVKLDNMMKESIVYISRKNVNSWLHSQSSDVSQSVQKDTMPFVSDELEGHHEVKREPDYFQDMNDSTLSRLEYKEPPFDTARQHTKEFSEAAAVEGTAAQGDLGPYTYGEGPTKEANEKDKNLTTSEADLLGNSEGLQEPNIPPPEGRNLSHARIYKCPKCNFKTAYTRILKGHLSKEVLGVNPYRCVKCYYSSTQRCNVLAHYRKYHSHGINTDNMCKAVTLSSKQQKKLVTLMSVSKRQAAQTEESIFSSGYQESNDKTSQTIMRNDEDPGQTSGRQDSLKEEKLVIKLPFNVPKQDKKDSPSTITSEDHQDVNSSHTSEIKSDKMYKCPKCSYQSNIRWRMKRHIMGKIGYKGFQCSRCTYAAVTSTSIITHYVAHHKGKTHIRRRMYLKKGVSTNLKLKLKRMLQMAERHAHGDGEKLKVKSVAFKDAACGGETSRTKESHLLENSEESDRQKLYKCRRCHFSTSRYLLMKRHITRDLNLKPYTCRHCKFTASCIAEITLHVQSCHAEVVWKKTSDIYNYQMSEADEETVRRELVRCKMIRDEGETFQCIFCKYESKHKWIMEEHMMEEIAYEPYACTTCNFCTSTVEAMQRHFSSSHPGQKCRYLICTNPSKAAVLNKLLEKGKKSNTEREHDVASSRYCCCHCGYETNNQGSFHSHLQKEIGYMPYKCGMCKYQAINRSRLLREHWKKSHAGKPFQYEHHRDGAKEQLLKDLLKKCRVATADSRSQQTTLKMEGSETKWEKECFESESNWRREGRGILRTEEERQFAKDQQNHETTAACPQGQQYENPSVPPAPGNNYGTWDELSACKQEKNDERISTWVEKTVSETSECQRGLRWFVMTQLSVKFFKCGRCTYRAMFPSEIVLHNKAMHHSRPLKVVKTARKSRNTKVRSLWRKFCEDLYF